MRKIAGIILATIMLVTSFGCVIIDRDHHHYRDRDRDGHWDGDRWDRGRDGRGDGDRRDR